MVAQRRLQDAVDLFLHFRLQTQLLPLVLGVISVSDKKVKDVVLLMEVKANSKGQVVFRVGLDV